MSAMKRFTRLRVISVVASLSSPTDKFWMEELSCELASGMGSFGVVVILRSCCGGGAGSGGGTYSTGAGGGTGVGSRGGGGLATAVT